MESIFENRNWNECTPPSPSPSTSHYDVNAMPLRFASFRFVSYVCVSLWCVDYRNALCTNVSVCKLVRQRSLTPLIDEEGDLDNESDDSDFEEMVRRKAKGVRPGSGSSGGGGGGGGVLIVRSDDCPSSRVVSRR